MYIYIYTDAGPYIYIAKRSHRLRRCSGGFEGVCLSVSIPYIYIYIYSLHPQPQFSFYIYFTSQTPLEKQGGNQ